MCSTAAGVSIPWTSCVLFSRPCCDLLSEQLVVHLHPLHVFVALLQPLVALTQLPDVVTSFGQDASFTLQSHSKQSTVISGLEAATFFTSVEP